MMGAIEVELVRDSADWLLVIVSVLTAAGTIGAVAVALFAPMWRERTRRPDVRLVAHTHAQGDLGWQKEINIDVPDDTQDYPPLWITNERAKDPALDVEVFVTVGESAGHDVWIGYASRANLLFNSPMEGHYGTVSKRVPAGFSRQVSFLTFGHPASIHEGLFDDGADPPDDPNAECLGIVATFPSRRSRAVWLKAGTYAVTFVVTGSNFDAVQYVGHFEIGRSRFEHEGNSMVRQTFRWTATPVRQPHRDVRPWRRRKDSTVPSPAQGDDWTTGVPKRD